MPNNPKTVPPAKKPAAELFATIRERFEAALGASAENRRNYVEDANFSCSADQWSPEVKKARGNYRPALTFNRLNGVVKQIIGDYRQNKLSIKVLPASGDASVETAEILAGIIRNIEQQSNADLAYVNALECSARGGFGYFRILTEYTGDDSFDQDIVIRPIHNPLTVYFDPAAKLLTREDANWAFVTEMIEKDVFERLYPDAAPGGFDGGDLSMDSWTTKDQVRVAEYFEKTTYAARLGAFDNGMVIEILDDAEIDALAQTGIRLVKEREAERTKIVWRKVTAADILDEREYKIRYIPIVPVIGEEVNLEGQVFTRSAIYYAKDAQRELNYAKSSAIEMTSLATRAPWLVTPDHIQGFQDQWDNANNTPLPYLVYNHDGGAPPPQRLEPPNPPSADMAMAASAGQDIQYTTGVFDASLGAPGQEVSGVAIGERQHQGATATVLFVDNLKKAIEHGGKIIMDFIPTVYDSERVVRVLDLEGNPQTEVVNQRQYNPLTGVTEVVNSITVGKYDVVIDTGPSFASRRREAQDGLLKLAQVWPGLMQVAPDLVVKTIDSPGMEQIAERVKRSLPPQLTMDPDSPEGQQLQMQMQQQQAHQEQQKQQLVQAHLQTEAGKQQAENAKSQAQMAKAQAEVVKANADVTQSALNTHTAHAKAVSDLATAAQPQASGQQAPPAVAQQAPSHPPVTIQFNAEHALNGIGQTMQGMAQQHMDTTGQQMQAIGQILAITAQTNQSIAASIEAQRQESAQQAQAIAALLHGQQQISLEQAVIMQQIGKEAAQGSLSVAEAVHRLGQVMAAPRVAVRDKEGNIVASEVKVSKAG